uniref:Guanine nucleotide-binding protein alpha subunit n=1 Tax=Glycine max TaxID=3847 RepID=I1K8H5_SOYBN
MLLYKYLSTTLYRTWNTIYYIFLHGEEHKLNLLLSSFASHFTLNVSAKSRGIFHSTTISLQKRPFCFFSDNMGLVCSRGRRFREADAEENAQDAEIERRIKLETKAEKHIQKLLLLGAGESGKSTIFKQIKLLFQTGFDEAELKSYIPVIHANVYQAIKVLHDGSKELAQNDVDSSKYVISHENQNIGEKLSEIGARLDYPCFTKELAQEIERLWEDAAIQETCARGNELQVPDCAHYFMENLERLSDANYVPTKEDVLYARVRTTGVVEIQFSPVGENKRSGEVYRLFDVGGQRNERRKWIHLFEGVTAVIFCAAISGYDQTLYEDENKNRMMETKELFEWVLKQPCFEKTSFMLFLNKFDIFEKKILNVRTIQMSTLCHRWSLLSFQFNTLRCAGSAQCM